MGPTVLDANALKLNFSTIQTDAKMDDAPNQSTMCHVILIK